ncbi:MAG: peptidoglycan-associated lipoprotein Pal [Gammaproteobacteria bacterium]|nr:MAG: peptidoglycan-associated lipoprotein Pal [Gammaproteobacteria bacterium]RKZ96805.1 MAG: peptidoglycan-associated lipoprotein Pal [Gammaproteobacteria bacterium]
MKLFKLSAVLLTLMWLSGCSTFGGDKEGAGVTDESSEVTVEDRNAESSGIEGDNPSGTDLNDTETMVIVGEDQYQGDELDDPASPLSNRVIYFEYDSSSVREEDLVVLEAHAAYLGDNPNVTIRLEGHTDERGAREYNLALGERRALSIRQTLMLQGAGINQFEVTSFGEERPVVEGFEENSWQQNRRVELIYIGH